MSNLIHMESCRGSLGCGQVPVGRDIPWLHQNVLTPARKRWRILAIDTSYSTSNVGSMIRCSSAFGVHAILISSNCADAWYRQSVRVSMGHIFRVPVIRCQDLAQTLQQLQEVHSVQSFGAVIDEDATSLRSLNSTPESVFVASRWCCVLGNEDAGISDAVRNVPDLVRLRVDMLPGVDSLSINNATAVLLNGLREREVDDQGQYEQEW